MSRAERSRPLHLLRSAVRLSRNLGREKNMVERASQDILHVDLPFNSINYPRTLFIFPIISGQHLSEGMKMKRPEIGMLCHLGIFLITAICLGATKATPQNPPILAFEDGYTQLFGDTNLMLHRDGKTVHLSLDQRTVPNRESIKHSHEKPNPKSILHVSHVPIPIYAGSGFVSQDLYLHGFFSASIKLPSDYTAGVVVAFYLSNGDIYEKNHDELDFEFLGNIRGKEWRIQTNVYGNGSTGTGREERYGLWFDPTEDFHKYSILWTADQIIFFVDNIPIREIKRNDAMNADFPSKPMSLYATIWDGSNWATSGGRYKVNYRYAPYTTDFSDLILHGCTVDPIQHSPRCGDGENSLQFLSKLALLSPKQRSKMGEFRKKHMTYSYCHDRKRYPVPLPECGVDVVEAKLFQQSGEAKFGSHHHRHGKRSRGARAVYKRFGYNSSGTPELAMLRNASASIHFEGITVGNGYMIKDKQMK
ncbi:hypothetical protein ACLOJK_025585 [Asimina triloba]